MTGLPATPNPRQRGTTSIQENLGSSKSPNSRQRGIGLDSPVSSTGQVQLSVRSSTGSL
ncbi:MAG TPA: hypothetical protein VMT12_03690 [Syntrophales bacterium]|nr:hypothetical protein [Syntrophales bacterium]